MATAALRELILSGELSEGDSLRQRELSDRLGVSQTPVREALKQLQSQGLITMDAHRGARVAESNQGALVENFQIRAALEGLAASQAAGRITEDALGQLEAVNAEIRALPVGDSAYLELNHRFHFLMYSCGGSPTLLALMRLLWQAMAEQFRVTRSFSESADQHEDILRALLAGDGVLAAALTRAHILSALDEGD